MVLHVYTVFEKNNNKIQTAVKAYCRTSLVSCNSIRSLELLAIGHSVIPLFTCSPSTAQDIFRKSSPIFCCAIFVLTVHVLVDSVSFTI